MSDEDNEYDAEKMPNRISSYPKAMNPTNPRRKDRRRRWRGRE
jgi:hypothetical protein